MVLITDKNERNTEPYDIIDYIIYKIRLYNLILYIMNVCYLT